MREIERLKEEILKDYPRLSREDSFTFAFHSSFPCVNDCCGDVNIFLHPYDIIRLKNSLGITSEEFLSTYTIAPFDRNLTYPVVLLQMSEDEGKTCPFVGEDGCRVYDDRPWSCRMYPLGLASPKENSEDTNREFFFLLRETVCKGFDQEKKWTVSRWLTEQGIEDYNEMGELFKDITLHGFFTDGKHITPEKLEMFFLVCYNIDSFRDFVFNSSFFDKFEVAEDMKTGIRRDDVELLKFGFRWLRFALFAEKTMIVKEDVLKAAEEELEAKKNNPQ